MLSEIKVNLDLGIFCFVLESFQLTTVHQVTNNSFRKIKSFIFCCNKGNKKKLFNEIEENICFKHKDDTHKNRIHKFVLSIQSPTTY